MFKVKNRDTRMTLITSLWCLYCSLWTYFTTFLVLLLLILNKLMFFLLCGFSSISHPRITGQQEKGKTNSKLRSTTSTHFTNTETLVWPLLQKASQPAFTYSKLTIETLEQRCEIYSKLTIEIPERRHWRRSGIFIVNFEHISHLVLVFLLLTLNM